MKEQDVAKKSIARQIGEDARNCLKDIHKKDVLGLVIFSLLVNFVIETLALVKYDGPFGAVMKLLPRFRGGYIGTSQAFAGFLGIFTHPLKVLANPLVFVYNACIIMILLSFALLFKKRYFVMSLLGTVWLAFGIANFVLLSYRVTPFSAVELQLIDAAMGVLKSYVSLKSYILLALVILLVLALLIMAWVKVPRMKKVNRFSALIIIAAVCLLTMGSTFLGLKSGIIAKKLPNLSVNYQQYGFVYCFVNSFDTGIGKPTEYSEAKVKAIQTDTKQKLDLSTQPPVDDSVVTGTAVSQAAVSGTAATFKPLDLEDSELPNIIFLQLESFFDITELDHLELSEDPIPTFRKCMEQYSSGFLSVPAVGAGTANTEFEVITGMNLDFFGPGEYPYKTVLKDKSCETACYNLKDHGYTAQAIHNNRATFYGRNSVFRQFGFDIFTSIELMNIQEYTENGWAKDGILTGEICKALNATEGKDYIYTISVQGHGDYLRQPVGSSKIRVLGGVASEEDKYRIEYYVNQIKEMDTFLASLMEELDKRGEDTILVAYGDHLPNLDIEQEQLTRGTMFQTQYFVWNNMDLDVVKEDVEAYQLSAKILHMLGVKDGVINSYHQANWANRDTKEYLDDLEILCYDMLYGDNSATDGVNIYEPTDLKYGVENVEVTSAFRDQSDTDCLIIKGAHFTNYSVVYIDDDRIACKFIDGNTLRVRLEKQTQDIKIVVKQCYKDKLVLQTSNEIIYKVENEEDVYNDGYDDDLDVEQEEEGEPEEDGMKDIGGLIEEQDAVMFDEAIDRMKAEKQ